eukprot:jgi/Chrpa1/24067/Chrysochromulina_OHIO_Genome00010337-RA
MLLQAWINHMTVWTGGPPILILHLSPIDLTANAIASPLDRRFQPNNQHASYRTYPTAIAMSSTSPPSSTGAATT